MPKYMLIGLLFFVSQGVNADVDWFLGIQGAFGGEDLFVVTKEDNKKDRISAGSGFGLRTGLSWHFVAQADIRASIGTLSGSHSYTNGSASFTRYPLDISSHYYIHQHGLGLGATYHFSPYAEADLKNVGSSSMRFDNALGYFVEYLYNARNSESGFKWGYYAGLRYSLLSYQHTGTQKEVNANHLSFCLGISL